MNTEQPMYGWNEIPWRKLEKVVFKLQQRIYQASLRGEVKKVHKLQRLMMKSWSAKCLAVRRVTQDNQGRKTAGVDGVKSLTPKQRLTLVERLKIGATAEPARRIWIPKPGTDEKRPLSIPTMNDRAAQALLKLALEPEWEARFEPNSYGFRPGRTVHDAIAAIFDNIRLKQKYVLDADIEKCFDQINHVKLLEKIQTMPTVARQIKAWLKSGVVDQGTLFPTDNGVPQGGVISPLLANIALHGMERYINEAFPFKKYQKGKKVTCISPAQLIRYADDLVVIHEDKGVVEQCQLLLNTWLNDIGLRLKPSKTRIRHTYIEMEGETGFKFLGFHIRQYPAGKNHSGLSTNKELLGFKTIIKPSKEAIKRHWAELSKVIDSCKSKKQSGLIKKLNPIIRGWCNYYSTVVSGETFNDNKDYLWHKLKSWAKRRHPRKTWNWVKHKYWNQQWKFTDGKATLTNPAETKIVRHIKVKGVSSPYDGNHTYWSTRLGKNPLLPTRVTNLLKKQKGKCTWCGLRLKDGDLMEIDHITPRNQGGKNDYKNLQLLHRHCHDSKTKLDRLVHITEC
ncbi:MAG: group II intron reverse transcriptase/maturase [Nostoc sp. DedQUE08]|uniref:group II intron reverse transcriptase/maturase n=1 Tax=Nostoc sp. DedQUE08 TaxID=3075393 RepID=UPI002AD48BDC|nr:group II intron reverse transcriptase/maturase [Nostoc sp. DedQUE08]MDZ8070675.1 group II intron reverse transcriptase/maturase [Nostoc sp. DedQUE08]